MSSVIGGSSNQVGCSQPDPNGESPMTTAKPLASAPPMALWAPFTDTIQGLSARLLVDEQATHVEVSEAILGALQAAHTEDVVVVSFAGHGSPDGSLVLFDTDLTNLSGTALPMTALADAFKQTRAGRFCASLTAASVVRRRRACLRRPRDRGVPSRWLRCTAKDASFSRPALRRRPPGSSPGQGTGYSPTRRSTP